ncbi:hypothetical protein GH825_29410 [Bacillus thuringiensis]|nr:hypothetical protein [Bacillus thuringiensis]
MSQTQFSGGDAFFLMDKLVSNLKPARTWQTLNIVTARQARGMQHV